MRERAEELGGTLTMTTGRVGHGTVVRAVLPCDDPTAPTDPSPVDSTEARLTLGQQWPA